MSIKKLKDINEDNYDSSSKISSIIKQLENVKIENSYDKKELDSIIDRLKAFLDGRE